MTTTTGFVSTFAMVAMVASAGCAAEDRGAAAASIKDKDTGVDVHVALLVRLEAKPGREAQVAALLREGRAFVLDEPGTPYWFATQLGPRTFGIFDAFGGDPERQAHLSGKLAKALLAKAPELLAVAPTIEPVDVIARKHAFAGAPVPVRFGIVARMEAKPGREAEVATLVESGAAVVADEPGTPLWFGIRLGPTTFGIFDAFADAGARQAHLEGKLAQALLAKAPELLAVPPTIEPVDVLASVVP
jgi:quinol monooxygenase YgiN